MAARAVAVAGRKKKKKKCWLPTFPDPQRDLKNGSLEPYGKIYKDYIGVRMGLHRGSNF